MTFGIDPNKVILTGENPFIRLAHSHDGELTTRTSLWKVLFSPHGSGNVLFIVSTLTGEVPRIYADNIQVARWFQRDIAKLQYEPFGDEQLEIIDAEFDAYGDVRDYWTETISSDEDEILMTWYDIKEPHIIDYPPHSRPGRPHGVYACMIPTAGAQITINGERAEGETFLVEQHPDSLATSSLAFSESWVVERG